LVLSLGEGPLLVLRARGTRRVGEDCKIEGNSGSRLSTSVTRIEHFGGGTAAASRLFDSESVWAGGGFVPGLEEKWVRLLSRNVGVDGILNKRGTTGVDGVDPRDGRSLVGV